MDSLPRETIERIAKEIIKTGDVIAKHGTSVENAKKIMQTGFNYNRTSYIMQTSDNLEALYGYGWKENMPGDATNVVIQVPREFFKDLLSYTDEQYDAWISHIKQNNKQEDLLLTVTDIEFENGPGGLPRIKGHIPKEFIIGAFVWCNNMTYWRIGPNDNAADNLNFIMNEEYYCNLSKEEKELFIEKMRRKILGKEDTQNQKQTEKSTTNLEDETPGGEER